MDDSFIIHGIDLITGNVSVTFTINGATYPQVITGISIDSLESLNAELAQKLSVLKKISSLNDSANGKQFSVQLSDIGSVVSITPIQEIPVKDVIS